MKIFIVAVNYNSYNELSRFLNSVDQAATNSPSATVKVVVADNSTNIQDVDVSMYTHIETSIVQHGNLGYLGGAQAIINKESDILSYDFVAISNVDIVLEEDFFCQLVSKDIDENVGWVATKIWSEDEGRDRNPKVMERYSKRKLQIINMMYRFPILDWLYTNTMYKKKAEYAPSPECDLYAGHGSFMLLTRAFFRKYEKIEYPIFLFGEELFLAELIQKAGLKVHYVPELVVKDTEHVSTGKMRKSFYYKCNKESIDYILKTFYNE